jgi:UDPglucose 6-dehydrogenase
MTVTIIGTGYVGLVTGACLANIGHQVVCVDTDAEKIEHLQAGQMPFYEPGLEALVQHNQTLGQLTFTTDVIAAVRRATIVIIAVGTPKHDDGSADIRHVLLVAKDIATAMVGYTTIQSFSNRATRSTISCALIVL